MIDARGTLMTILQRPLPRRGVFEQPFWDFVGKRQLRLQKCDSCGHFRYPPGPVCPECLGERYSWTELSGRGRVLAWTTFHRQYFSELPVPYTVVSVATKEGPLMIGNFVNAPASILKLDLPVRAVYEEAQSGDHMWRICQWEPDEGAGT
jgi:hypothetical protein